MQKSQKGFTLIELVVVIVLLGILGVTALAKYQDLSADATTAANSGIASEMAASASINYAAFILNPGSEDVTIDSSTACDATDANILGLFATGTFPDGYDLADLGTPDACTAAGDTMGCTVQSSAATPVGTAAVVSLICTGG
jgi:MSHA pilin protein MshA